MPVINNTPSKTLSSCSTLPLAFTYSTEKSGTHTLTMQFSSTQNIAVDWGDGSNLEFLVGLTSLTGYTHDYPSTATKTVNVYALPSSVLVVNLNSQVIVDTVAISSLTSLVEFQARSMSGMTDIEVPASSALNLFYVDFSGLTSLDFPAGITYNQARIYVNNSSSLSSLTFTGTDGDINLIYAYSCAFSGTLVLDNLEFITASIYCYSNSGLTAISTTGCTGTVSRLYFNSCNITGAFNFVPAFAITCIIFGYSNANMTEFTYTTVGKPALTNLQLQNCGLTTNPDFSNFDISFASVFSLTNNTAITSVTLGTGNTGNVRVMTLVNTSVAYFSFGGYKMASNVNLDIRNCGMTAAEVNEWLYNLDGTAGGEALLPLSGTGTINISGTNAAPDGSSGGFDGLTAKANIIAAGYTLTTT